jgi:glycosyltransferase involved in cell wall biosynthesis
MKVTVFAYENLSLTGGNVYDSLLYKLLKQDKSFTVEFSAPIIYKSGFALKKLFTPFIELGWLKRLRKSDVVIWNSVDAYHCLLLAFCLRLFYPKKKLFILHHHYKFVEMTGVKKIIFRFFELNFLRTATSIIIPSPYILDQTKKYLPSSNITYLEIAFKDHHQTVDRDLIKKGQMLCVGTIEHRKGLHLLLEALFLLKSEGNDFSVNILGAVLESDYYENLLQKIKAYGLENNVLFRGRVSEEEKEFYMKTSDVFVFPSLLEGYGMVIIEAMAFGLPVIAFNNSAIPYKVKDGYNGLLVVDQDIQDMKQKLSDILNNSNLRDTLSMGALETFSKSRKSPQIIEDMSAFVRSLKA